MKASVTASDGLPQVKLQTLEDTEVTPFDQLTGYYIHDKGRIPFYPGQVINPTVKPPSRRKRGASKGSATNERIVSPVDNEATVSKPVEDHDVKGGSKGDVASITSPVKTESVVTKQQELHDGMEDVSNPDRTNQDFATIQSREWFGESSTCEGGIDLSLPTDFAPLPLTEITEDFSVPVNQMDHTRIEVSNFRRKSSEGEPATTAEVGNGNNMMAENEDKKQCLNFDSLEGSKDGGENSKGSNEGEEKSSSVPQQPKDERIKAGVTKENVGDFGITDLFLMVCNNKV